MSAHQDGDTSFGASCPLPKSDGRPQVKEQGAHHEKVDLLVATIGQYDDGVYQRGRELVTVVGATDEYVDALASRGIEVKAGTPVIVGLTAAALHYRLSSRVQWCRLDQRSEQWVERSPASPVIASLFAPLNPWKELRPIVAITETPVIHLDDGSIQESGYDPKTGYVICASAPLPPIPSEPTIEDARATLATLRKPFDEFPYQTEDDRDVPIALALTILLRPSLPSNANTPGFLFRAPQKDCGKSLAAKASIAFGEGRTPASCTWSDEREEQEKAVSSAADAGLRALFFDNVEDEIRIGGAAIDKRLTCSGRDAFRVLGVSARKELDWRTVVIFTAKRARMSGDGDRRFVVCEMQRPDEKPVYQIDSLETWVLDNRPDLLAAAYTMLRAWVLAGKPSAVRDVPSFEPWSRTVAAAIHWAGGSDVTRCVHDGHDGEESDDVAGDAERVFLEQLHTFAAAHDDHHGVTVKDHLLPIVYADPVRREHGEPPPWKHAGFAWADLADAIAGLSIKSDRDGRPDGRALGDRLRAMKNARHGAYRLMAGKLLSGKQRWLVKRIGGPKLNGHAPDQQLAFAPTLTPTQEPTLAATDESWTEERALEEDIPF